MKIVIERHPDGYVAYPLGLKGVVVGQGNTYDDALADVTSAIKFHIETFGRETLDEESPVLEVHIAETRVGLMPKFPVDAPKARVLRALQALGFASYANESTSRCRAECGRNLHSLDAYKPPDDQGF